MEPIGDGAAMEIRKEAAAWLIEMDDEPERWDRQRFLAWLKASPRHLEEFLYLTAIWRALDDDVERDHAIDVRRQLRESGNVVGWPNTPLNTSPVRDSQVVKHLRWVAGLAAVTLVILSAVWVLTLQTSADAKVFATAIGEQRALKLPDGSVVHLNTNSRAEIRFTDVAREVHLLKGEALFSVEHDPNRPFQVHADRMMVQAIGTYFNVRRRASDTIVSVIEGSVLVHAADSAGNPLTTSAGSTQTDGLSATDMNTPDLRTETHPELRAAHGATLAVLAAGEQARIHLDGVIEQRSVENVRTATAWRERNLVFNDAPLSEVAAEVARYNVTPELRIEGEALGTRRLTGVFAADDPESLIQFLERDTELSVTRSDDMVVIRSR